ncbi:MAG: helix-turn-helix domain-containing protein [Anaerolineae bacterium]|nr:helix-turn-helix domain-containing protein [Anaerolineae bacterium]
MPDNTNSLLDALTIKEIAHYWNKHRTSVRYHINRGNFKIRYTTTGRIMVARESVEALWGPPLTEINETDF